MPYSSGATGLIHEHDVNYGDMKSHLLKDIDQLFNASTEDQNFAVILRLIVTRKGDESNVLTCCEYPKLPNSFTVLGVYYEISTVPGGLSFLD